MKVRCTHCGYEWDSKTRMYLVTCPKCSKKVKLMFDHYHEGDQLNGADGSIRSH